MTKQEYKTRYAATTTEEERQELWREYMADEFVDNGHPFIIEELQGRMVEVVTRLVSLLYSGSLGNNASKSKKEYRKRLGNEVAIAYMERMNEFQLATTQFNMAWLKNLLDSFLTLQYNTVPYKTTGLTQQEQDTLCTVLCIAARDFLIQFHSEGGIQRLKDNPDIFGSSFATN